MYYASPNRKFGLGFRKPNVQINFVFFPLQTSFPKVLRQEIVVSWTLSPFFSGQNPFQGTYTKQDIWFMQKFKHFEYNKRKLQLAYDIWLKQKLGTFKDSTWHTQRHKHVAIMHLNSWIWSSMTKHPSTCYPTTFRSKKSHKTETKIAIT